MVNLRGSHKEKKLSNGAVPRKRSRLQESGIEFTRQKEG